MPKSERETNRGAADESRSVVIEKMALWDVDLVATIEAESFPIPWASSAFISNISDENSVCIVARAEGVLVGYAVAWMLPREMHIGNIAVRAGFRRRKIGARLLASLLELAGSQGVDMVTLEVRKTNVPALGLYRKYGFKEIAIKPHYYPDGDEDAVVMVLQVGQFLL